jgi:hypothetical protein
LRVCAQLIGCRAIKRFTAPSERTSSGVNIYWCNPSNALVWQGTSPPKGGYFHRVFNNPVCIRLIRLSCRPPSIQIDDKESDLSPAALNSSFAAERASEIVRAEKLVGPVEGPAQESPRGRGYGCKYDDGLADRWRRVGQRFALAIAPPSGA